MLLGLMLNRFKAVGFHHVDGQFGQIANDADEDRLPVHDDRLERSVLQQGHERLLHAFHRAGVERNHRPALQPLSQ